jgi:hypothetical protein
VKKEKPIIIEVMEFGDVDMKKNRRWRHDFGRYLTVRRQCKWTLKAG